ncbi:SAM-dependent methyltransferase [Actinobacteria bacterium YIM 96077]|uniref:SAM-dependent methyltransferase n=2 Tax=Phytoactinopolyspora halophila TaxID=1981511 RepID=A0A329QJL8_9ACTN|nr:SAM-dependent methyltransferase [Actinobacteria bacterium YIM 96077]RAW12463.1 SAM-dependent methyltransferase [Phytoactinopolyspora halophila]
MKDTSDQPPAPEIDTSVPHSARIWNYWMGGKDNFQADRDAGDAVAEAYPDIVLMAKESRQFLIRVVSFLAGEVGINQFLDVGTGLPTMQNTHEVAQRIAPDSRIVYVDNDPLVLAHARALLADTTPDGVTAYVDADYHNPDVILADARNVLNFNRPVAVMFMGVLGYVSDFEEMRSIVSRLIDPFPSGSYLVLWDGTDTGPAVVEGGEKLAEAGGVPYHLRSPEQLAQCFEGLEMVEPGLVPITTWRAESDDVTHIDAYGAVARKP